MGMISDFLSPISASFAFLGPIGILVFAFECELKKVRAAVDAHPVYLPVSAAVRLEGDPLAVGRPGGLLVRAFAGQNVALMRRQIGDADLEAAVDPRGVRQF